MICFSLFLSFTESGIWSIKMRNRVRIQRKFIYFNTYYNNHQSIRFLKAEPCRGSRIHTNHGSGKIIRTLPETWSLEVRQTTLMHKRSPRFESSTNLSQCSWSTAVSLCNTEIRLKKTRPNKQQQQKNEKTFL